MLTLNLPEYAAKVITKEGKRQIFDPIRKKYVALTPEEWVRQHFINYLIVHKKYPSGLLANEVSITLNKLSKRCDTVVYNRNLNPVVIVEYKAPTVEITPTVFDQIVRYNMALHVKYLMISNGFHHYCCQIDYENQSYQFLSDIPYFTELAIDASSADAK
ncbi:type I restriction enzyme HsdR N-terminal domain-containing protein [Parabacteroides sp. OttesenSCG-928-G07]|nr:type I restriction enzyme HsdR N-terminal domain-containing protein [Parabacteroides sp. OttesenSCG-928-G07]